MKNKRFPKYPDDADYTTNAPSYYEDLARKEKLIRLLAERIWGYEELLDETLEQIQERFRAWDKNLEDFPEDVKFLLQQWLDDGTLDHIINDTIFNWKLDTEIFEQYRTQTNQLISDSGQPIYADMTQETIQELLDQKGLFIFNAGIYNLDTLYISSDTTILAHGAVLTTTIEQKFAIRTKDNAKNIVITGFEITGVNGYQVGIGVGLNNHDVHILNNHIHDLRNENNKQVIGIIVPSLGCYDILIAHNTINDLLSVEDGVVGTPYGGWCKGIAITVGLELYSYNYASITDDNITKRVTVKHNTIEDIYPEEDADGILVDVPFITGSTVQNWKLDHVIENNFFKNCAKRFIKIMVASGVTVRNNIGVHSLDNGLRACISAYNKNFFIEGNKFYNRGSGYIRYGVDFGLDEEKYTFSKRGKGIIKDNFFECGRDDHLTGKQTFGITFNQASLGYYNTIIIKNNYMQCGYKPFFFPSRTGLTEKENGMIKHLEINKNTIETGPSTLHNIEIGVPTDTLIIQANTFKSEEGNSPRSNPILIFTANETISHRHVVFKDNYLGYTLATLQFKDIENLMLFNNIVNNVTSAGITRQNVTKEILLNNYGIFNQGIFS